MTTLKLLALTVLLTACGSGDDSPFGGSGGSNTAPPEDDGTTTTGDTGASDGGSVDGGTSDGGASDGGGDGGGGDTGFVIEGTGYSAGDVAYDLSGTSNSGSFSLHDYYGSPVLLVVGNMDDTGYQSMMSWLGAIDNVVTVALVNRDESSSPADTADASGWVSTYGVDHVVIDPTGELVSTWAERNPPKTYLIDAEMVIYWTYFGTVGQSQVEDKIRDMGI